LKAVLELRILLVVLCITVFCAIPSFGQYRSFDELFPQYTAGEREQAFSPEGLVRTSENSNSLRLLPFTLADTNIQESLLQKKPRFLIESLSMVPFPANPAGLLGIYNACGKVRNLKGRLYHSFTRDKDVPLFEEATRIESARRLSPIPDPPETLALPQKETMYIRLKDANFGNSYYQADISINQHGLMYNLTNFRNLTYLFITAIREGNFFANLYIEPLAEGILIYSVAGADVSDFIASKIDIPSAIEKRLAVITGWISDGIRSSGR
jgi:hypothetical protein